MDGDRSSQPSMLMAFFLVVMMACLLLPLSAAQSDEMQEEQTLDGRVTGILIEPNTTYHKNWTIVEDAWVSFSISCNQCTAELSLDGTVHSTSTDLTVQAQSTGEVVLNVTSLETEHVSLSLVESIDENYSSVRPAPSQATESVTIESCTSENRCIDPSRNHLDGIVNGDFTSTGYLRGIIEQSNAEYIPLAVMDGDTLELQLRHAIHDLKISAYFQNSTSETLLESTVEAPTGLTTNADSDAMYVHVEEDGRILLKVESEVVNAAWVIKAIRYQQLIPTPLVEDQNNISIRGHHQTSSTLELTESQALNFLALVKPVELRIEQLSSGSWIMGDLIQLEAEVPITAYPLPNISAVRIHLHSSVHWVEVSIANFSDFGSGHEAPSVRPSTSAVDNSSWPDLPQVSSQLVGQLTLPIFDTADVYRLNITGWEDSRHMIQVTVEGSEIENLTVEFWSMEQSTWEVLETKTSVFRNGKIQLAMEVDPGTHFVRISLPVTTNFTGHSWGENVPSIEYFVSSAYTLTDEGYEPYFPPDEHAEKWGVRSRFILGVLFLAPVIYFAVSLSRQKKAAELFANKSEQLEWFRKQMDSGEVTPTQSRKNLIRALQSITLLDWDQASRAWGKANLEHRTTDAALAVWALDRRLATTEGSIPLMVGIHVIKGNWDLAALRFDAPEGKGWTVENVQPRFLHRGEEVFIDTMAEGNRTFVMVELTGTATAVDVELNGRVDGTATASRIPKTLAVEVFEEE